MPPNGKHLSEGQKAVLANEYRKVISKEAESKLERRLMRSDGMAMNPFRSMCPNRIKKKRIQIPVSSPLNTFTYLNGRSGRFRA